MGFSKNLLKIMMLGGCSLLAVPAYAGTGQGALIDRVAGLNNVDAAGFERILPPEDLVGAQRFSSKPDANWQFAQSNDAAFRINQLEEQIRLLNGRVEDMTFQMLQMQEQIRKVQEDNEFRFQDLEQRGDLKTKGNKATAKAGGGSLGKSKPSDQSDSGNGSGGNGNRKSITDLLQGGDFSGNEQLGAPPTELGTLTFDADGNLIDSNVGKPIDLTGNQATIDFPNQPGQLFNLGYEYIQAGEYLQAQDVFEQFVSVHFGNPRMPEAKFWLGESLFAQGDYEEAAKVFLENHKAHPNGALGAQNLLKLGVSLAGLDQRELACATYAEVPKKYPNISNSVRKRIDVEQRSAKCKNG